jgi:hypothetical protein
MMNTIIQTDRLTRYFGSQAVVRDLDLRNPTGAGDGIARAERSRQDNDDPHYHGPAAALGFTTFIEL